MNNRHNPSNEICQQVSPMLLTFQTTPSSCRTWQRVPSPSVAWQEWCLGRRHYQLVALQVELQVVLLMVPVPWVYFVPAVDRNDSNNTSDQNSFIKRSWEQLMIACKTYSDLGGSWVVDAQRLVGYTKATPNWNYDEVSGEVFDWRPIGWLFLFLVQTSNIQLNQLWLKKWSKK